MPEVINFRNKMQNEESHNNNIFQHITDKMIVFIFQGFKLIKCFNIQNHNKKLEIERIVNIIDKSKYHCDFHQNDNNYVIPLKIEEMNVILINEWKNANYSKSVIFLIRYIVI